MRRLYWAVVLICAATLPADTQTRESFDLIIQGGRIVDGTGNPSILVDIGLRGDRIARIAIIADVRAPER